MICLFLIQVVFILTCSTLSADSPQRKLKCGNKVYTLNKILSFRFCRRSNRANISDQELLDVSSKLWTADQSDRISTVSLNLQGKTKDNSKDDNAPQPLFNEIPPEFKTNPIYAKQIALYDDYTPDDSVTEHLTPKDWTKVGEFLDVIMLTEVMQITHAFLSSKGVVPDDPDAFKTTLFNIWFSLYERSGALSSSGAEHVHIGETQGRNTVSGLHNWVRFALLEDSGDVNYLGYVRIQDLGGAYVIRNPFFWGSFYKAIGGFLIGTSPAFNMALDTLCFYARPDAVCNIQMNGKACGVQSYTMEYKGNIQVASSFPTL